MRLLVTAAALAAIAGPVVAQTAPPLRPTRDVDVTYRVTSDWEPTHDLRMAWGVSAGKMRMEKLGGGEWYLLDVNARSAVTVVDAQRTVTTMPFSAAMTQPIPADARFARRGSAQVAGTACTEWEVTVPQGRSVICVTADGVMLRSAAAAGEEVSFRMEAISVRYDPPAAVFTVPQGYRRTP
ncbi:hypothetical protein [Roseomonas sp. WA12]